MSDPKWAEKARLYDEAEEQRYREQAKLAVRHMNELASDSRMLAYIEGIHAEMSQRLFDETKEIRDIACSFAAERGVDATTTDNALTALSLLTLFQVHREVTASLPLPFQEALQEMFGHCIAHERGKPACYQPPIKLVYADEEEEEHGERD